MPANPTPSGALPARFRRTRVLIVGCGDVGQRAAGLLLRTRVRVLGLTSSPEKAAVLRARGIVPLVGNLDRPATLRRLAGLGQRVLHLAPPPTGGSEGDSAAGRDPRTAALLRVLATRKRPAALVYGSTSGVYGDCGGAWIDETRPVNPRNARALRRVDAEMALRRFGRAGRGQVRVGILRIPGIYAPDRVGGTPRARLERGTPVLRSEDDVYTNHIHADDLARACVAALWRGKPQRVVHASDDTELKMGDYFDLAAGLYGLPRPPRISRAEAALQLPALQMSFMAESRRMLNGRLKGELRVGLRYPTVARGLV
ncbi:MAG: SDR family oxidoreductase [Pseudomonadota bacterium]